MNSSHNSSYNSSNISSYFFPRGHDNEFSNLIRSLRYPDFPIPAHCHGNVQVSFGPFVCKSIEMQKLFSKQLFIGQETESEKRKKLSFRTDFYCNIEINKFLFTSLVSVLENVNVIRLDFSAI